MSETLELLSAGSGTSSATVPGLSGDVQRLPFTVRVVRTEEQLAKVCELRSTAYGRHLPELRDPFSEPDDLDRQPGTLILLAEDKATGLAIGTARLQLNTHTLLQVEQSVAIPPFLQSQVLAEITRLSVRPGYNQFFVRNAIWKACHRFCLAMQVHAMLITSRRSLVRQYLMLGFTDVFPDAREVPCGHVGGIKHRILKFEVQSAEREWHTKGHPMYEFMFRTYHPDIEVFAAVSSGWARPRSTDRPASLAGVSAVAVAGPSAAVAASPELALSQPAAGEAMSPKNAVPAADRVASAVEF